MSKKRTNKKVMPTFVTPTGNQAIAGDGALPDTLSTTGNSVNIANNQIGVLCVDHDGTVAYGNFISTNTTTAACSVIKIVEGTVNSADTTQVTGWEDVAPAYIASDEIHADMIRSVTFQEAELPTHSADAFSSFNAPEDETLYKLYVEFRSVENDRDFGGNVETLPVTFITPDYTTLGTTNPLDHLLKNMLFTVNLNSRLISTAPSFRGRGQKNVVALGLNTDALGGAGVDLGTIALGDSIPVQTADGVTSNLIVTRDILNTIAFWIDNPGSSGIDAATTIEVINLTTAGTAAAGAGTIAIDAFIIMGTDERTSVAYDDIYSKKVRVDVELSEGFRVEPLFTKDDLSEAFDGYGDGRQWRIRFDERAFGRVTSQEITGHKDYFLPKYQSIDESVYYNATIIDFYDKSDMLTREQLTEKRVVILLDVTDDSATTDANTGITISDANAATVADLQTALAFWLDSAKIDGGSSGMKVLGDATAPTTVGTGVYF